MNEFVLDASVVLKWFRTDGESDWQAAWLITDDEELLQVATSLARRLSTQANLS